jgi:hypothetical protein
VETVLRVTLLDRGSSGSPYVGDSVGTWLDDFASWASPLASAGVPLRLIDDPIADDDEGLLVVPDPTAFPNHIDRAMAMRRPVLTGRAPEKLDDVLRAVTEALGGLVRPDLRGVLVLRLDDPGSSQRRHLRPWSHPDVAAAVWDALWRDVRGFGRVSVFCCPGWVDEDGTVRRSRDASPHEWQHLDDGVAQGLADLECHGFTHIHHDRRAWVAAADRFDSDTWYRELGRGDIDDQSAVVAAWQAECGLGTTVVPPGEMWDVATVVAAKRQGFSLFNSWTVCRLDLDVPVWATQILSPYLDQADSKWTAAELPVVGYWHDRDMAVHGPDWVGTQLAAWREAGITRAMAFADLARAWQPIDAVWRDGEIEVRSAPAVRLRIDHRTG